MKKNYFKNLLLSGFFIANSLGAFAQLSFTNSNSRLTSATNSGCPTAVVDWNNDGLDDIIRLDQGKTVFVEVQRTNQTFQSIALGSFVTNSGWAWGMCVVDLDQNGFKDIIAGGSGSGGIKVMMINSDGISATMSTLPNSSFFLQNITAGDFNNDGWIDLFTCDDNNLSKIYVNNGSGSLFPSTTLINFDVTATDDSGNYGSVFTDFDNDGDMDLYIAKCRQGVNSPTDGRRINVLFVNNGDGTYTENADEFNLNIGWQSWTASPGDIDNDGDMDFLITNHDYQSQILLNDGTGHYTDITASTGFNIDDITPIQSVMEDFDNDGLIDLFITGTNARLYKNNGNLTFTRINGLFNSGSMASFAIGDANHDGSIDVFGLYNSIYTTPTNVDDVLWLNDRNNYNFINFDLEGTTSNHGAIGAKVTIYGPWGIQVREVRAGESYGTVNSSMLHFGLGENESVDSAVIRWPSGSSQTLTNLAANQFLVVTENECISPSGLISGSFAICNGQPTTLSATVAGLNYLWSTGETTQSISVSSVGEYNVLISAPSNSCNAISRTITVIENPIETPSINYEGSSLLCAGSVATINADYGYNSYLWSNGVTTQNLSVTEDGFYSLNIQGECGTFTSNTIEVNFGEPVAQPLQETINVPNLGLNSVSINSANTQVFWYDAPGGNLIGTGNPINVDILNPTTTLYAQNYEVIGGGVYSAGKTNHTGVGASGQYSAQTTNSATLFQVFETCTLKTVKVYTDRPGNREIQLKTSTGTLLMDTLIYIPMDSTIIQLNWEFTPGNYTIGTNSAINQQIPNNSNGNSPRLKRNNSNVTYPYILEDVLSINNSEQGPTVYYYFYDWQVEKAGINCLSELTPIEVIVAPTGIFDANKNSISVFPNPASGVLNVNLNNSSNSVFNLFDAAGRKVMSKNLVNVNNTIDIIGLAKGIYQVQVVNGENVTTKKLSIQ
jgi:hypothetical protein